MEDVRVNIFTNPFNGLSLDTLYLYIVNFLNLLNDLQLGQSEFQLFVPFGNF